MGDAQILGYAGLAAQALRKAPTRVRSPEADDAAADADLETVGTDSGDFRGLRVRGRLSGNIELEAFYGVDAEALKRPLRAGSGTGTDRESPIRTEEAEIRR